MQIIGRQNKNVTVAADVGEKDDFVGVARFQQTFHGFQFVPGLGVFFRRQMVTALFFADAGQFHQDLHAFLFGQVFGPGCLVFFFFGRFGGRHFFGQVVGDDDFLLQTHVDGVTNAVPHDVQMHRFVVLLVFHKKGRAFGQCFGVGFGSWGWKFVGV